MAQDSEPPKAADKGKAKAVDGKPEDTPKDKDGKPIVNGKKKDEKPECSSAPVDPLPAPLLACHHDS